MTTLSQKPTALITGATGFVGSRLAHHLVANSWNVSALLRPSSKLDQLKPETHAIDTFIFDGSVQSLTSHLQKLRPDVVFHLASVFLPQHRPDDIPRLMEANITFGAQLLEAMAAANLSRLVNAGTFAQHFENAPYSPVNLYAATKQAFEAILAFYCQAKACRAITLKLFDTYGPNDPRSKLLPLLATAARENKTLDLSPGEQLLDLTYIDDVVQAFLLAALRTAELPPGTHESFAVSGGQRLSLRDLIQLLQTVLNIKIPANLGGRPYRDREVMIPWSTGPSLPNWSPKTSLADGIRKTFQQDRP